MEFVSFILSSNQSLFGYLFYLAFCLGAAVWTLTYSMKRRIGGAALAVVFLFLSIIIATGTPRNVFYANLKAADAKVLAMEIIADKDIFLWVKFFDEQRPTYVHLPWNSQFVEELQKLQEGARRGLNGAPQLRFEPSFDKEPPMPYAMPIPAMPPKPVEPSPPQVFERDA